MLDDNAGLDSRMRARYRAQYRGPPVAIVARFGIYSRSHTSSHHFAPSFRCLRSLLSAAGRERCDGMMRGWNLSASP